MAVVNLIHKTVEEYASKVLENKLYFFLEAHSEKMLKPLLETGIDDNIKSLIYNTDFDSECARYAGEYLAKCSQKFIALLVKRGDIGWDYVITLPERKEEVRKKLQKLNYIMEEDVEHKGRREETS